MAVTIDRLFIINAMLRTTGLSKLGAVDTQHPLYIDASDILDVVLAEFNAKHMWFNSRLVTLAKAGDGTVTVPTDTLAVDSIKIADKYAVRGTTVFDLKNNTNVLNTDIDVLLLTNISIEDMPPIARTYVIAQARYEYFFDQDGDPQKTAKLLEKAQIAYVEVAAVNLEQQDINFFYGSGSNHFFTRRNAGSSESSIINVG